MAEHSNEQSRNVVRRAVLVALIVVVSFVAGMYAADTGVSRLVSSTLNGGLNATPDESVNLDDFWSAWNTLNERFIATSASTTLPSNDEKIWGAIEGLADSYQDPYTVFLPPEESRIFREDILGNFSGVGIEIGLSEEGILTVIAPLKNTPAERAGLRSGDLIIAINGETTEGMTTEEAVKLIRGPKGSVVEFRIVREDNGGAFEVAVTRDTINVPTIDYGYDPVSGVYTITLHSFTATANRQFVEALIDFHRSGSGKLLLDLRGNPGGYLQSAVSIASRFLPKESVVVVEDYGGKRENVTHRSTGATGVPEGTPVAILIDRGSASASEILAGALKDHGVATLIGEASFGKGSVQELVNVGGGSLKITIARWLTPAGHSISAGGLTPDIEVEYTEEDREAGRDPQRERAIQFLTTGE